MNGDARWSDFLLKEYDRRSQWMLKDEELGEKRSAFFLTLAGVASAVFTFGFEKGPQLYAGWRNSLAAAVLSALLLALGIVTVRRLILRAIVTDRHFLALRDIARVFVSREQAHVMGNAFGDLYKPLPDKSLNPITVGKGGWFEIVALVNAVLGGVCLGALAQWAFATPVFSFVTLVAGIAATWMVLGYMGSRLVRRSLYYAHEYDRRQCAPAE